MNLKLSIILLILLNPVFVGAQIITGNLNQLAGQEIKLEGFDGLKTYPISNTKLDEKGNFSLTYSIENYGVGYLISSDEKALFVILSGEDIEITGEALSYTETTKITKGQENQWFEQYAQEHPRREQALGAWVYLEKIYTVDPLFAVQKLPSESIFEEKNRIQNEDEAFLNALPQDSYVRWFLPARKLISAVSVVAQYRTEEIPATIAAFRAMDYTDPKLYKSGLLKDAIDSHFWLLENSGRSLDDVFLEMEKSIDQMLPPLLQDNEKLNNIGTYLFNLLEEKSLFKAAAYLSTTLLNEETCTLSSTFAQQLEGYRKMEVDNIAADIFFTGGTYFPNDIQVHSLKEIPSEYKLVIFAAGWCSHCIKEIPLLLPRYEEFKKKGIEMVLVSLDENPEDFARFAGGLPFMSTCDFKKWEGKAALDYHVFGTPTFYLLDKDLKILLKPNSVKHFEAWADWKLQ